MLGIRIEVKTENSQRLLREASLHAPGGVQGEGRWYEPFPLFIKRASGARIWDVDDNEYIDYHASFGPAVLGHNDPRIRESVIGTLENEGVLFGAPHPKEAELAKLFSEVVPCADMTVICGGGGSDPMYNAVRVARAYTGKKKLLKFEGGYHGWHDYVAASSRPSSESAGPPDAPNTVPLSGAGSLEEAIQQIVVAPFNDEAALERIIEREKDNLAAIIIEPVCHSAGCLIVQQSFLRLVRQICDDRGIVLIFDEVLTGFRHHVGGVQKTVGVTPDLGVFGKAMANGYPISALAGKRDIMSLFSPQGPVYLSGTFLGHLLGVTASLKTIEILKDGQVHEKLWRLGSKMSGEINAIIDELELNARCYSYGSVWCLYFTRKVENFRDIIAMTDHRKAFPKDQAFRTYLLNHGIFIHPHYTNRAFISAAHTDEDVDKTIEVTRNFLTQNQSELR